jgi:5-methylcytosine-specific restriction enzyme A
MARRKTITTAMRVRIFQTANGVCHLCGLPIHAERGEKWHVEHIKPLWLGGEDAESNMAPAHIDCHSPKTASEAKQRAKVTRQAAVYIGADAPRSKLVSRGFPKKQRPEKLPIPQRREIYVDE